MSTISKNSVDTQKQAVDILLTRSQILTGLLVTVLTILVFPAYSWVSGLEKKMAGLDVLIVERTHVNQTRDDRLDRLERKIGEVDTRLSTVQTSAEASEKYLRTLIEWERESRQEQNKSSR